MHFAAVGSPPLHPLHPHPRPLHTHPRCPRGCPCPYLRTPRAAGGSALRRSRAFSHLLVDPGFVHVQMFFLPGPVLGALLLGGASTHLALIFRRVPSRAKPRWCIRTTSCRQSPGYVGGLPPSLGVVITVGLLAQLRCLLLSANDDLDPTSAAFRSLCVHALTPPAPAPAAGCCRAAIWVVRMAAPGVVAVPAGICERARGTAQLSQ